MLEFLRDTIKAFSTKKVEENADIDDSVTVAGPITGTKFNIYDDYDDIDAEELANHVGGKPITGYRIVYSKNSDMSGSTQLEANYMEPGKTEETEITYAHGTPSSPLDDNETYYYQIYPVNADGVVQSAVSPIVNATTLVDVPHQPVLTLTRVSENQVLLEINNLDIDTGGVPLEGLKVQRKDGSEKTFRTIHANTKSLLYTDTITPQVKSTYIVSAINTAGLKSIPSDPKSITLEWNPPILPNITLDSDQKPLIQLADPGTNTQYGITNFILERSFKDTDEWSQLVILPGTPTTYTDMTVLPAKDYSYRVRITRNNTLSPYSNIESIDIPSRPPDAPKNLMIKKTTHELVDLEWDAPLSDGGNPTVGYKIEYSTTSAFSAVTTVISENTKYAVTPLSPETTYYFRVYAYNERYSTGNPTSNVVSIKTSPTVFGVSDTDFTVSAGSTATLNAGMLAEFRDLTIEDGATLQLNGVILKVNRNYTEQGTGKIIVLANGCVGGKGGKTYPGRGGRRTAASRRNYQTSPNPGTPASLVPPVLITKSCTNEIFASSLLTQMLYPSFISKFRTQINGGKGSSGTDAQRSGNGGRSGSGGRWANSWRPGTRAGDGAKSADGVDGVRGGGKAALFINNIVNKITVEAKGLDGNNGNRGTGTPGQPGGGPSGRPGGAGQAGGSASTNGTLGSKGSDGGIVYLLYNTIPAGYTPAIIVSGGLGGYNGGTHTGTHPLSTRAASGEDGLSLIAQLNELSR